MAPGRKYTFSELKTSVLLPAQIFFPAYSLGNTGTAVPRRRSWNRGLRYRPPPDWLPDPVHDKVHLMQPDRALIHLSMGNLAASLNVEREIPYAPKGAGIFMPVLLRFFSMKPRRAETALGGMQR